MDANELAGILPEQTQALYRYVPSISRDSATAEDLVQETMVRALEKSDTLRSPASLRSWLFRIAHNTTIDYYRRQREEPSEDLALEVEKRWQDDDYTVDAAVVVTRAVSDLMSIVPAAPSSRIRSVEPDGLETV